MNKRAPADGVVLLAHGDGGLLTRQLVKDVFLPRLRSPVLALLEDGAVLEGEDLVFTTDAHVVSPLFFPGGDIGRLAVAGTVNDLAVMGAAPLGLSAAFIIEEGFALDDLRRLVASMEATAEEAGVEIVAADTKVVDRGKADGVFVMTAGVGKLLARARRPRPSARNIREGDVVVVSGPVGQHGVAILSARADLGFETGVQSDVRPLNRLIGGVLEKVGPGVRFLRDPTRGGLATALKEAALAAGRDILIYEEKVPCTPGVRGACEFLGLDYLYLACEGRFVAVCSPDAAEEVVRMVAELDPEAGPAVIGEVRGDRGRLLLRTVLGATRPLELFAGEGLPRIC